MTSRYLTRLTINLVAVAALGLVHLDADAAARFARATGLWNAAIWSATSCIAGVLTASVPGAADDATICAGNTVTLDSSRTVNTVIVNGSLSTSTFTLTIDNTPAVTLNTGGTFTGNATLILDGATTVAAGTSASITFNNLSLMLNVALGGTPRTYTLGAGSIAAMTVNGNFDIVPTNAAGAVRALSVVRGTVTGLTVGGRTRAVALGAGNDSASLNTTGMTSFTSGTLELGDAAGGTGTNTLTAGATAITLNGATGPLFTRTANGVFTAGTSTVTMNSGGTSPVTLTSGTFLTTNAFNNFTVNMASPPRTGTLGAAITVNTTLLVQAGTLSNNNFAITSDGASAFQVNDGATFAMTGTSAFPPTSGGTHFSTYTFQCGAYPSCSTVSYRQTTSPLTLTTQTYGHLDLAPAGAATQRFPAGAFTVNGNLTAGNGTNTTTADAATNSTTLDVNGGVAIAANATLTAHATNSFTVARDWTNNGAFTNSGGTVTLDGAAAQSVGGTTNTTFNNLTIANTVGGVSLTSSQTVGNAGAGTLTLTSGTFSVGANTLTLNGPTIAGTPANLSTIATSSLTFGGGALGASGVSVPSSVALLSNLTINNVNGITLSSSPTVNGTLTFTLGNLNTTPGNTLTLAAAAPAIVGAGTSRHVVGNLARVFPALAGTSFKYEVGDGTNWTPVTITFPVAPTSGSLTVTTPSSSVADHPDTTSIISSVSASKGVNRYWTLKGSTVAGTFSATVDYINGTPVDLDAGVTVGNFVVVRGALCNGSGASRSCSTTWARPTLGGVPTTTQATATGMSISNSPTIESDFVVGEPATARFSREREFIYTRELYFY